MNVRKNKLKLSIIVHIILVIMLFCSVGALFVNIRKAAAIHTSNIGSASTNLGELLLEGYEEDTSGKGSIFDKEIFWEFISQISGEKEPNSGTLDRLTETKTSSDFRDLNGGKDVVVTIGGKKWLASYLSANASGEPILTFWLACTSDATRYHQQSESINGKFPNNMYGTSEVRAISLNNGGSYATSHSAASLTDVTQNEKSKWAIYTMPSVKGSIASFIEVPDNMQWQHEQSAKTSASQGNDYNNDALDFGGDGVTGSYEKKNGYANWANDRLWLPSLAEIGVNGKSGLWEAADSTRANDRHTYVRSAYSENFAYVWVLLQAGYGISRSDAYKAMPYVLHFILI